MQKDPALDTKFKVGDRVIYIGKAREALYRRTGVIEQISSARSIVVVKFDNYFPSRCVLTCNLDYVCSSRLINKRRETINREK